MLLQEMASIHRYEKVDKTTQLVNTKLDKVCNSMNSYNLLTFHLAGGWISFTWSKKQFHWSNHQLVKRRRQLKTVLEQSDTSKNIETKTSTRHRHDQTSNIAVNTSNIIIIIIIIIILPLVVKIPGVKNKS